MYEPIVVTAFVLSEAIEGAVTFGDVSEPRPTPNSTPGSGISPSNGGWSDGNTLPGPGEVKLGT